LNQLSEYDIETALTELGVESAGPPGNPRCYPKHELARQLYSKLHDKLMGWGKHAPKRDPDDDVIVGNG